MSNKKLTGTLIPKDNKKAKMHATFYSDKPVGSDSDSEIFNEYVDATDQQRNTALANVSNQTANSTTGKMGYKVLEPTKTFTEQVTAENTIYEIRDVFDLGTVDAQNPVSVTMPDGCVLKFNGGLIKNGTLVGNNTDVDSPLVYIFDNVLFSGTWDCIFEIDWLVDTFNTLNTSDSNCVDAHDKLQFALNSGVKCIRFSSSKKYHVSDTVIVYNLVNIYGQTYQENKTNLKSVISSTDNITLLKFVIPSKPFQNRLYVEGIELSSGSSSILDKDTPILKIQTNNSDIWGIYINLRIVANGAPNDVVANKTVVNMTGVEIESVGGYISFTRIDGYISAFRGVYIHGDTWITDTKLLCETSCVKGGYFEKGFPVFIENNHQSNQYYSGRTEGSYFEGGGSFINYGVIWDNYNGYNPNNNAPFTAMSQFKCYKLTGNSDINNIVSIVPNYTQADNIGRYMYMSTDNISNFSGIVSNNADFENNDDDKLTFDIKEAVINYRSIVNISRTNNISNLSNLRPYTCNNIPYLSKVITDIYLTKFNSNIYFKYSGTFSNSVEISDIIANVVGYKTIKKLKIFDTNNLLVFERNNIREDTLIPIHILNNYKFEIIVYYDDYGYYVGTPEYLIVPTFNFSSSTYYDVANKRNLSLATTYKSENFGNDLFGSQTILAQWSPIVGTNLTGFVILDDKALFTIVAEYGGKIAINTIEIDTIHNTCVVHDNLGNTNYNVIKYYAANKLTWYGIICTYATKQYILRVDGQVVAHSYSTTGYSASTLTKTEILRKGSFSSKPTLTSTDSGYIYYDTTNKRNICWNGTAWVNLDGTALS